MNRGAWWATVHGGHKELDITEQLTHTHTSLVSRPQTSPTIQPLCSFPSSPLQAEPQDEGSGWVMMQAARLHLSALPPWASAPPVSWAEPATPSSPNLPGDMNTRASSL